jgi:GNAT superfamily N-acetyltransferase
MAPIDGLQTRALTLADAEPGYHLSSEAGWNQTIEDWRMMLTVAPALGQLDDDGVPAASALVMPYGGRIGWIAMVLTTAGYRRQGLATANLRWAIDLCAERGLIAGLDATPAGREVYRPLGFRDLWSLKRWMCERAAPDERARAARAEQESSTDVVIRPVDDADLDDLAVLDAALFGAPRDKLLAYLRLNQPRHARIAVDGGKTVGFVLARTGRLAHHVGPLVAPDAPVASALLKQALAGVDGQVSIDIPDHQTAFQQQLKELGFAPVRPFMRMIKADPAMMTEAPASGFAIAGPELG